ncbi:MAG: nucleoside permease [Cyclobacteriaceae bacterium]|nr:nucleoside permease [Cyclobacteriaceae bacterium]
MTLALRFRLSSMMLLQYFIWGCWYVTLGNYLLNTLDFSGDQVGHVYSTFAIAAMISPFFVGMIADKYFSVEKLLGTLHILGAVLLFVISQLTDFTSFYISMLLYALCYTPTMALSNSLSFSQMKDPGAEFPSVRVLGTIGWIVAGLTISFLGVEDKSTFFVLASGVSAALGIYSFTLPNVPPGKDTGKKTFYQILGLDAFTLLRKKDFAIMILSSFLISIPLMFYYLGTNAFLNELHIENAAGKMTLGQMSEILFMLVMPFFFRRLGVKKMIMVAMLAWTARYLLFAYGNSDELVWMLYTGIILHGICYDFFFVTGQIFVDRRAPGHLRSSAQGLVTFATYGMGFYFGSLASGKIVDFYLLSDGLHDWRAIWLVPAMFAIGVFVFFTLFFKDKLRRRRPVVC